MSYNSHFSNQFALIKDWLVYIKNIISFFMIMIHLHMYFKCYINIGLQK